MYRHVQLTIQMHRKKYRLIVQHCWILTVWRPRQSVWVRFLERSIKHWYWRKYDVKVKWFERKFNRMCMNIRFVLWYVGEHFVKLHVCYGHMVCILDVYSQNAAETSYFPTQQCCTTCDRAFGAKLKQKMKLYRNTDRTTKRLYRQSAQICMFDYHSTVVGVCVLWPEDIAIMQLNYQWILFFFSRSVTAHPLQNDGKCAMTQT